MRGKLLFSTCHDYYDENAQISPFSELISSIKLWHGFIKDSKVQRWFFNIYFGLKLLNASAMQILNVPSTFLFYKEGFCSIKYNNFNLIRSDIIIICWPTIFLQLPASSEVALGHCYSLQFLSSRPSAMHLTTAAEESPVVGLILLWINTTPPFPETVYFLWPGREWVASFLRGMNCSSRKVSASSSICGPTTSAEPLVLVRRVNFPSGL